MPTSRTVVRALLGALTIILCSLAVPPAAQAAGPPVEICAPASLGGCNFGGRVAMHPERDSSGTWFRRLYVCDFSDDGHAVGGRVDFGTEVRQFIDPDPNDGLCRTHVFYVDVRKFRMVIGSIWASDWKAPPTL
jgi:hypothetical protein